jgi:hypothetical protein
MMKAGVVMKMTVAIAAATIALAGHAVFAADQKPSPPHGSTSHPRSASYSRQVWKSNPAPAPRTKASAFAPRPSKRHVYGAPIQRPILTQRGESAHS